MSLHGRQPDLVSISIQILPPMVTWPAKQQNDIDQQIPKNITGFANITYYEWSWFLAFSAQSTSTVTSKQ